jgi:predicted acyltransferase
MSQNPEPDSPRLLSLDAYRGFVMLAMASGGIGTFGVLASSGDSSWSLVRQVIAQHFDHAAWRGCNFWDLIQPSFMFLVGAAMPFSYARRRAHGDGWLQLFAHAVVRSLVLVALGVFLASTGKASTIYSFVNVLAQIGLGYTVVFLLIGCRPIYQFAAAVAILFAYWLWFVTYPLPGPDFSYGTVGATDIQLVMGGRYAHWNKNTNAAAAFDRWFLNQFPHPTDQPFVFNDGGYTTLNFIPSIATMLCGVLAGELLRSKRARGTKAQILLFAGAICWIVGSILDLTVCPSVKRIWTPTWVVASSAWTLWMLAAFYAVIDVAGFRNWSLPLAVVGTNSIAFYLMAQLAKPFVASSLRTHFGADIFDGTSGALVRGLSTLLVFWLISFWLYRQKLFIKI